MNCMKLLNDGQFLISNKQYEVAEEILAKAISILEKEEYPEKNCILAEGYNNLGYICYKKVEFKKAVEYYNKSIKLNTSYGIAYYNRGTINYRLGFYENAVKDMEYSVLFQPDNVEFRTGLEECRYALKLISS